MEKKSKILVIDDNRELADAMTTLLGKMGYGARAAYGGADAIKIAPGYAPDTVFLDISMPEMDGYETIQKLQKIPELAHTRFFAVSGFGQENDRTRSLGAGFTGHLVKPIGADDLQKILAG